MNGSLSPEVHQADDFAYVVVDPDEGGTTGISWPEPFVQQKRELIIQRFFTPHNSEYDKPRYYLDRAPKNDRPLVLQLVYMHEGPLSYPKRWQEVVDIVVKEMNQRRVRYNEMLKNFSVHKVIAMQVHIAPITFQTIKVMDGWEMFLRIKHDVRIAGKMPYDLHAVNSERCIVKPGFFGDGLIERQGKNPAFYFAKKPIEVRLFKDAVAYIKFQTSPIEKKPLSMLTPENVFQEMVLAPEPLAHEPTIP
ncbi:hypothetical protein M1432_01005 [Patescibacteria group bacterium]|nr:hypothetical protein [Patescibacteria group bacterium]